MRGMQVTATVVQLLLLVASVQGAEKRYYDWVVDYHYAAPDCVEKLIIAVNGEFPGPSIHATEGDTIVVKVTNRMPTEAVVIHWHGMIQTGTCWADGAASVSQCPIDPEDEFTYEFVVENPGTFFWHGHYGMQRAAGFYGGLIVDAMNKEPFSYEGNLSIILNDWWHRSMLDQELGLFSNPLRWVGEPQSLLIEGRGSYDCSLLPRPPPGVNSTVSMACDQTSPQCQPYIIPVEAGKTYRLRIASVASLSAFNFILEGHSFTVVEADGHYVEPVVMNDIDVYSGESYSVIFTADQDSSRNYWAAMNVRARHPMTPPGLAILHYINNPPTRPNTSAPVSPLWDNYTYSVAKARSYVAREGFIEQLPRGGPDRQIFLLNTQNKLDGKIKWALNNLSFAPIATPVLAALKYNINVTGHGGHPLETPPDYFPQDYDITKPPPNPNTNVGSGFYTLEMNKTIDIILQNACTLSPNVSEVHPWHLHGHDFWVLGYGDGKFNASSDYANLNYYNPPQRNTVPLFPFGWTVIRFVTNNSGIWPFHCHIEPHFHLGMGVVFAEGVDQLPVVPRSTMGCGETKYYNFPDSTPLGN